MQNAFESTPSGAYPARHIAWRATFILALLYWLSVLDRFIIALLVDPIKRDLDISDLQFSMLHGFAFALTYAIFGLIAGALADKFNRRTIIFISVTIWSLATAACGLAQHYWQLLIARVGVGCGESGLNPCATSMITDLFPRERLTSAMAVYTIGATVGSGMAYLFGGLIVDLVAESEMITLPLVGEMRSWQAVFIIIGLPGALLSLIIFTVPEPVRRDRTRSVDRDPFWTSVLNAYRNLLGFMRPNWRFFMYLYSGFALASIVLSAGSIWYPAHMSRAFGWSASEIGLSLGLTLIVSSFSGKLIGGYAMDALYQRGYRDAQLRWFAGCLLVATPFGFVATTSDNPWVYLGGIGVFLMVLAPITASASTALNLVTPNELRGTGIAFYFATASMLGSAIGPILVAAVSDYGLGEGSNIGLALGIVLAVCCPLAAMLLALGCRPMRDVIVAMER